MFSERQTNLSSAAYGTFNISKIWSGTADMELPWGPTAFTNLSLHLYQNLQASNSCINLTGYIMLHVLMMQQPKARLKHLKPWAQVL